MSDLSLVSLKEKRAVLACERGLDLAVNQSGSTSQLLLLLMMMMVIIGAWTSRSSQRGGTIWACHLHQPAACQRNPPGHHARVCAHNTAVVAFWLQ